MYSDIHLLPSVKESFYRSSSCKQDREKNAATDHTNTCQLYLAAHQSNVPYNDTVPIQMHASMSSTWQHNSEDPKTKVSFYTVLR